MTSSFPLDVPFRFEESPLLWTVDEVYSPTECQEFIRLIESKQPAIATNNPMYRNQDRVMLDDPAVSQDLFGRLMKHLPFNLGDFRLARLNERLRFYRYKPGQNFSSHMDHWYQASDTEITLLSVWVYFNGDFQGGETLFIEQLDEIVKPQPGRVAIFQHKIRHEGCEVRHGTKYAMRTDVIYTKM